MSDEDPLPRTRGIRKWSRRALRCLRRLFLAVLGLCLVYGLAALVLGLIPVNTDDVAPERGMAIYVWSSGIHTDFVVPVRSAAKDWSDLLRRSSRPRAVYPSDWISFGWGDRGFYLETPTWGDLTVGRVFSAVFLPSSTVMHVEHLFGPPKVSDQCRELVISEEQYGRLVRFIEGGFQHDAGKQVRLIPDRGYGDYDEFFEARGSYHLFNTCNNWANRGLATIGVRTAVWSPFDVAIFYHLERR